LEALTCGVATTLATTLAATLPATFGSFASVF